VNHPTSIFFTTRLRSLFVAAGAFALVNLSTGAAHATTQLSLDAGGAFTPDETVGNGWGISGRLGHRWKLAILTLTPELSISYHKFSGLGDPRTIAGLGGVRAGIDFIVQPSVFVHAGVGNVNAVTSHTSIAYDFGGALDLTLLPVVDIGPHVVFSGIAGDNTYDPFTWVEVGGHITFNFGD